MSFVIVGLAAGLCSLLTLYAGFGLGTLLLPVFALFFPLEVAVAATALVHLANNLLKVTLFARRADWELVVRFALPAVAAAFLGATVLGVVAGTEPMATYTIGTRTAVVTPLKLLIAGLMLLFAAFEVVPAFRQLTFERSWLTLGGALSGFFGGLSGHQGALRSAFLAKTGVTTEAFLATNAISAVLVDLARLVVYGAYLATHVSAVGHSGRWPLVAVATGSAFLGVAIGSRFLKKVSMDIVQTLTAVFLAGIAAGLAAGII